MIDRYNIPGKLSPHNYQNNYRLLDQQTLNESIILESKQWMRSLSM